MHEILLLTTIGLAVVCIMLAICALIGQPRDQALGRSIFAWLIGAGIYTGLSIFGGTASIIEEIAKFFPIFGIPAGVAYGLSRFLKK